MNLLKSESSDQREEVSSSVVVRRWKLVYTSRNICTSVEKHVLTPKTIVFLSGHPSYGQLRTVKIVAKAL